jgi:hypothetical protein
MVWLAVVGDIGAMVESKLEDDPDLIAVWFLI